MTAASFLALPGNEPMASAFAARFSSNSASVEVRQFPDGESHVRLETAVKGANVVAVCTLDRPDRKILPLIFAADAARELGAASVGLVAPYLAYMRQDARFETGEAVSSHSFARLISGSFDWLVTVDPHLHRYKSLSQLYTIPAFALHAAPLLSDWIARNIANPILVGPDRESRQWVSEAASRIGAPFTVLDKERKSDRQVLVELTDRTGFDGRTPVILDDIVSSGETVLQAAHALSAVSAIKPVCVAVHAICADGAQEALAYAGVRVVTTNSIAHASNAIDVSELLGAQIAAILRAHP